MSKHHGKHRRDQPPGETSSSALQRDVSHRKTGKVAGVDPILAPAATGIVTVRPGTRCDLGSIDADADGGLDKEAAKAALATERARIAALQERLYTEHARSLLVVFQEIGRAHV